MRTIRPSFALVLLSLLTAGVTSLDAAWPGLNGKIAFESVRDGNSEIYVMHADGAEQTNLTNHPAADRIPAWSPDGKRIAFQSDRAGHFDIYVMNADGSHVRRITDDPAIDANAWWSPDGEQIVFSSSRDGNCPAGTPVARCLEIYVMNADGTDAVRLTHSGGVDSFSDWQPITRLELCHATGSARQPYQLLEVGFGALADHLAHGDVYPVPPAGCPAS